MGDVYKLKGGGLWISSNRRFLICLSKKGFQDIELVFLLILTDPFSFANTKTAYIPKIL